MLRVRGSEMPLRQYTRTPLHLKTSSSDSDPLHHRPITERSPKLGDRRSPRGGPQTDTVNQKKLGTRIADLESQLTQAQQELKSLKNQLVSAEAAKKEAQEELEKKAEKPIDSDSIETLEDHPISVTETRESDEKDRVFSEEIPDENHRETDVFEVPMEKPSVEPVVEVTETEPEDISNEKQAVLEPEKPSRIDELVLKEEEICYLKSKLDEKERELEAFGQEKEGLKKDLSEANSELLVARTKQDEANTRLRKLEEELETSKENSVKANEKLESVEAAKEALEAEMKMLRVQTEQWRKAADAAAAVLSGGFEMNGRRVAERCGSMDKNFGGVFEPPFGGFVGSPCDDFDDGFGNGKRKGTGIRKFGDLWKKKGHK